MEGKHIGSCICGAVEIEATGAPAGIGYCHCDSWRHWSAGPVNAFTLWAPDAVGVVKGAAALARVNKTENSDRMFCQHCGGHVMTRHPGIGLIDVYAATLPSVDFQPGVHVNDAETVLPTQDGLAKYRDFRPISVARAKPWPKRPGFR